MAVEHIKNVYINGNRFFAAELDPDYGMVVLGDVPDPVCPGIRIIYPDIDSVISQLRKKTIDELLCLLCFIEKEIIGEVVQDVLPMIRGESGVRKLRDDALECHVVSIPALSRNTISFSIKTPTVALQLRTNRIIGQLSTVHGKDPERTGYEINDAQLLRGCGSESFLNTFVIRRIAPVY